MRRPSKGKPLSRKPYPHEELIQEIREIITGMRSTHSISDDSDQWHVGAMGYSPMERIDQENARGFKRVKEIAQELVEIGEPAAEAVALGIRMRGYWREYLIPYVTKYKKVPLIREAVVLVKKRERDRLSGKL